ncbi:MAG: IS3 family transposase [Solobacterium sp.]|nr:IS3 family transposase [Solobacterium sp.]
MASGTPKARRIALGKAAKENIYKLIQEYESWGISWICKLLVISRAAYYKWKRRCPSQRDLENRKLFTKIQTIAESNNSLFGKTAMTNYINHHLEEDEQPVNHKRVYRLMCINNIRTSRPRYARPAWKRTTPEEVADNLLSRNFNVSKPNEGWCTDITEISVPGSKEKIYISTIIDLYDRYPVGIAVSRRNDTAIVHQSLEQAVKANPGVHPLFHSDRGFQYTRAVFKKMLEELGMTQSMSRVSRCIDNGPMEGFQGILKEMIAVLYPNARTYEELETAIYGTIDYYINEYPQNRFKGKTSSEVRREALSSDTPVVYPIPKNNRIIRYWDRIHSHQNRSKA